MIISRSRIFFLKHSRQFLFNVFLEASSSINDVNRTFFLSIFEAYAKFNWLWVCPSVCGCGICRCESVNTTLTYGAVGAPASRPLTSSLFSTGPYPQFPSLFLPYYAPSPLPALRVHGTFHFMSNFRAKRSRTRKSSKIPKKKFFFSLKFIKN